MKLKMPRNANDWTTVVPKFRARILGLAADDLLRDFNGHLFAYIIPKNSCLQSPLTDVMREYGTYHMLDSVYRQTTSYAYLSC